MEMMRTEEEEEDTPVSIPISGPIYIPNLIGPLTTIRDFETSVFHHLLDLEAEIRSDSSHACNEDISVDELKIFSEEELVNKAFEEAFKDGEEAVNSSHLSEDPSSHTRIGVSPEKDAGVSHFHRQRNTSASIESTNGSSSNKRKNTSKKRKMGRHQTNGPVDVRDELEQLLDDDDDMVDLYVSRKLAGASSPVSTSGAPNWYLASPTIGSKISRASVATILGDENDVEELEMLLEAYFMQIDGTLNKLTMALWLLEYVEKFGYDI